MLVLSECFVFKILPSAVHKFRLNQLRNKIRFGIDSSGWRIKVPACLFLRGMLHTFHFYGVSLSRIQPVFLLLCLVVERRWKIQFNPTQSGSVPINLAWRDGRPVGLRGNRTKNLDSRSRWVVFMFFPLLALGIEDLCFSSWGITMWG